VFECRVCGEHRVVWLNDRRRQLGRGVNAEFEFRLFAVVRGEALEEKSTESRTSATAKGVENEEALEAIAVVCKPADLVHGRVDEFLSNSVMTACIYEGEPTETHTYTLISLQD
jgi:hypothetical protein